MNLQAFLDAKIRAALSASGAGDDAKALVLPSGRPDFGDYQGNGVMAAAKATKANPRELAAKVVAAINGADAFASKIEVAGPGFINITLSNAFIGHALDTALSDPRIGVAPASAPQKVVVDYSSPNLAKEMHVGHLRSTIIGDALARVLSFLGHDVVRANHVGDWGTQFGMLLAHMIDHGGAESTELSDLEAFYIAAKKRFDDEPAFAERARESVVKLQSGDPACLASWRAFLDVSLSHCESVYRRLGVLLDRGDVMGESAYNDRLPGVIEALEKQGLTVVDQGALCVFMDDFKGKDGGPLPIIVRKGDGGFLYMTTDLAALRYRHESLRADRVLYVFDARQAHHAAQVIALGRKAGFAPPSMRLEHVSFGMVMGKDGKPFKTRDGGTVKLAGLLDEAEKRAFDLVTSKNPSILEDERREIARVVGVSAVKYADLSKHRASDYVFDFDSMISFDGNTAPYLLYARTRVVSIFRKGEVSKDALLASGPMTISAPAERTLALSLLRFPETLAAVDRDDTPHILCAYLFDLAQTFSSFYEACPVLAADDAATKASRLKLCLLTADTLSLGLSLLGIETLERM